MNISWTTRLAVLPFLIASTWCVADESPAVVSESVRLPETQVIGTNEVAEEQPFGPNQQPEWTTRRRFTTARVYVQPPWQIESETGWQADYERSGRGAPTHLLTEEIELGLPYRFQVDYEFAEKVEEGDWHYDSSSFEVRWAVAEWGKIPLNPTLKAEWKINDSEADAYEFALSLGEELAPRWHWGAEFFYEQQVGDDREREFAIATAFSYTLIDEKLGVGVEMKLKDETDDLDRHSHLEFLIGPSIQWRPTPRTHLDVVPLLGATGPSPRVETFVFFGIDFGPGPEREGVAPASLRNK